MEEEVQQMRAKHSETIQKLKAQFLQEKKQFQDQSDTRIQAMAKQANQESASRLKHSSCFHASLVLPLCVVLQISCHLLKLCANMLTRFLLIPMMNA